MNKINSIDKGEEKEAGFAPDDLLHISYDQLANGSRYPYCSKKIDPETKAALQRLFDIRPVETIKASSNKSGKLVLAKVSKRDKNQGVLNAGFEKHFSDLSLK